MRRTRIVVLHMKEVIYTAVFAALAIVLIIVLVAMFHKGDETKETGMYQPGVYTASVTMGENVLNVEVVVDKDRIHAISMKNLSDEVATMYPLVQPCLDVISQQIYTTQSLDNISYNEDGAYTSELIMSGIREAVEKAKVKK